VGGVGEGVGNTVGGATKGVGETVSSMLLKVAYNH